MPLFCPSCNASNARGNQFCTECGAPLTPQTATGAATANETETDRASAPRRSRHRHTIGSAARAIARVRALFILIGVLNLVSLALMLIVRSQLESTYVKDVVTLMIALSAATVIVCFIGTWATRRNPLPWAIALASLLTINVVTPIVIGTFPGILSVILMIMAWGALAPIMRLRRLMAGNPDDPALARVADSSRHGSRSRGRERPARRRRASEREDM